MELTMSMIKYGYFMAGKLVGRRNIDHQDIAHEAFCRALRRTKPVPQKYHNHYIALIVKQVFYELYTNKSNRKHDVMLAAAPSPEFHNQNREHGAAEVEAVDLAMQMFRLCDARQAIVLHGALSGKSLRAIVKGMDRELSWGSKNLTIIRQRIKEYLCEAS